MKYREIIKILHDDGWREVDARTKGSHMQFKHSIKAGKVTIPKHTGDLPIGTVISILRQAAIDRKA